VYTCISKGLQRAHIVIGARSYKYQLNDHHLQSNYNFTSRVLLT